MLRAGLAYIFSATTTVTLPAVPGLGATVDLEEALGASDHDTSLRVESRYRFNRRHSLGISWYHVGFAGQKIIAEDITIDDVTVGAGASTNTSLELDLWRLLYNYSFYRGDKMEVAFSPGLYMTHLDFDFAGIGTITSTSGDVSGQTIEQEKLTLPLPSLGMQMNYDLSRKLQAQLRGDFFWLKFGEYEGSMFEVYLGLEYRLFRNFAVGAAFDRLSVNFTNDSKDGLRADMAYNQVYLYGTLYAFDTPL